MKRLTLLLLAFTAQAFADPQVVLLKLDDVVARKSGDSPVSARWVRVADYLKAYACSRGIPINGTTNAGPDSSRSSHF